MLEPVREYAGEHLALSGEEPDARRRHRDHFLRVAEELAGRLEEAERLDLVETLEADQENLRAALAWSLEKDPEDGLRLAVALDGFWRFRSRLQEGCQWVGRLLDRCQDPPRELRAAVYLRLGVWTEWQGDLAAAASWYLQSLAAARAVDDPLLIAAALSGLGTIAFQQQDYHRAAALLDESAALFRRAGKDRERLRAEAWLASTFHHLGDDVRARAVLEECLARALSCEEYRAAAQALDYLGDIALGLGDLTAARDRYTQMLAAARARSLHELVVHALTNLSRVAWLDQDYHSADSAVEAALDVARQVGSPVLQTLCLNHRARLAFAEGDLEQLRSCGREGLELAWRAGEMCRVIPALRRVAALALARGELGRAAPLLAAADRLETTHGPVNTFDERAFRDELLARSRSQAGLSGPGEPPSGDTCSVERLIQDALRWAGSLPSGGSIRETEPGRPG
jgi:tetratricopeptide (TPR) repeat protein